jgi:hypothetical protein
MGFLGRTNFLFVAPLILYFFYSLVEFYHQMFPSEGPIPRVKPFIDMIRNHKFFILEGKSRLEFIYFFYLITTIPIDLGRILKCIIIGQFLMLKYNLSAETRHSAYLINAYISNAIKNFGPLHRAYTSGVNYLYKFVTQQQQRQ